MGEEWVEYDGGPVQEWHRNASHIRVAPDVAVIPEGAFNSCVDLRAVDLGNVTTISADSFYRCHSLERVIWTAAASVEISEYAFAYCKELREIDLRNVTKIGEGAFHECKALERVTIPSPVASIEACAFHGCENLVEVELGEGMQSIEESVFSDCSSLARVSIPASVTVIEDVAFSGCSSLVEAELNEGLQRIGEGAFKDCTSLFRIDIPSTTKKVGDLAFDHCHQLESVAIEDGLQMIGVGAFCACRSLERINIPSSVNFVGDCAFSECTGLTEVTLSEGVHVIDSDTFAHCTYLDHIDIPPVALVGAIEGSRCHLLRATMPVVWGRRRRLVVSRWLQYRSPGQLAQAEAKVNEILGRPHQPEGQKIALIRDWFAYCDLLDVTTMLELAVWRVDMNGTEQNAEARQARRRNRGNDMNIIIPRVLPFLENECW